MNISVSDDGLTHLGVALERVRKANNESQVILDRFLRQPPDNPAADIRQVMRAQALALSAVEKALTVLIEEMQGAILPRLP